MVYRLGYTEHPPASPGCVAARKDTKNSKKRVCLLAAHRTDAAFPVSAISTIIQRSYWL